MILAIILQISTSFWSYWGDGNAELNHYAVTQNRYGQLRNATEYMIYVTEPFNLIKQVKADSFDSENANNINVLKLNRIKDFQTGIYDYNLMTSIFVATEPFQIMDNNYSSATEIKISFSSQEWCGNYFHQINRVKNGVRSMTHSYFESDADNDQLLDEAQNTIFADNLFIRVRELINKLNVGTVDIFPTLESTRLLHKPFRKKTANISVQTDTYTYQSKGVVVREWTISADDEIWTFLVEKNYPRKILFFEHSLNNNTMESGMLINSIRLPYWKLNQNGDESYLKELELSEAK